MSLTCKLSIAFLNMCMLVRKEKQGFTAKQLWILEYILSELFERGCGGVMVGASSGEQPPPQSTGTPLTH